MKFRIGPVPDAPGFHPEQGGWRKLKEPSFGALTLLALPTAALIAVAFMSAWAALARVHGMQDQGQIVLTPRTLLVSVAVIGALAVLHELAYAAALPRCGLTSATIIGFWPQKLTPYVSYAGELSRNRHSMVHAPRLARRASLQ